MDLGARLDVVKATYKWKPVSCVNCCSFGHGALQCPDGEAQVAKPALIGNDPVVVDHQLGVSSPLKEPGSGDNAFALITNAGGCSSSPCDA